jgi:hypothetical protein
LVEVAKENVEAAAAGWTETTFTDCCALGSKRKMLVALNGAATVVTPVTVSLAVPIFLTTTERLLTDSAMVPKSSVAGVR